MAGAKYKDNKPEMEKKRRSRINESLSCLKLLVLGEVRRKNTRISKLDKADILEMAVEYVQRMSATGQMMRAAPARVDRYRAGFNACAEEVRKHLAQTADVDIDLRTRIVDHLANFVQNLQWLRRHDILPHDVNVRQTSRGQHLQVAPLKDTNYRHLGVFTNLPPLKGGIPTDAVYHNVCGPENGLGFSRPQVSSSEGVERLRYRASHNMGTNSSRRQPYDPPQHIHCNRHERLKGNSETVQGVDTPGKGFYSSKEKKHTSPKCMALGHILSHNEQQGHASDGSASRVQGPKVGLREVCVKDQPTERKMDNGVDNCNAGQQQGDLQPHEAGVNVGVSANLWRPW